MLRQLGHVLLFAAVLAATGTDWIILQSIAWTGMLADNLQKTTWCQAVDRTFDGNHLCPLCKAIAKGKKAEKKAHFSLQSKRLEFVGVFSRFTFIAPTHFRLLTAGNVFAAALPHAPPSPPPRLLFA